MDDVVRYYSPGTGSPFAAKVDALRTLAGVAKLSIDVPPVSSQGGHRKAPISDKRVGAMVDALADRWSGSAVTSEPYSGGCRPVPVPSS